MDRTHCASHWWQTSREHWRGDDWQGETGVHLARICVHPECRVLKPVPHGAKRQRCVAVMSMLSTAWRQFFLIARLRLRTCDNLMALSSARCLPQNGARSCFWNFAPLELLVLNHIRYCVRNISELRYNLTYALTPRSCKSCCLLYDRHPFSPSFSSSLHHFQLS
jgi:hypothetical protein